MNGPKQVNAFLARLSELTGSQRDAYAGMRRRHDNFSSRHISAGTFPGNEFIYVGESYNLERTLTTGSFAEARRRAIIALLLEQRGDNRHCVRIEDALSYEGFEGVLSRFERDMLSSLSADDMIGPAFDSSGQAITEAFCVWRRLAQHEMPTRELVLT